MKRNLKYLLCGLPDDESELGQVLNQIAMSLNHLLDGLIDVKSDSKHMALFGPFIGRSLLELGCTAIISRIDPFRILILRQVQMQSSYNIGAQNRISIKWQGDVLGEKVKFQQGENIWSINKDPTRALLGDYYEHIYWRITLESMLDKVADNRGGDWFAKIRSIGSEGFCNSIRGELQRLYSTLSKGIHHEFVIPTTSVFDYDTISSAIRDCLYIISSLGFIINSISHLPYKISFNKSLRYYENIQNAEII